MKYCFHHIPKTAGSSLQLRLSHREHIGQLPEGSTLVVYPMGADTRFYRVCEDKDFNEDESIKTAFLRTYKRPRTKRSASIVMGHLTTVGQAGEHFTWLRHPLERDVSHYNYDRKFGNTVAEDFETHGRSLAGNFQTAWLYKFYLGNMDTPPMEKMFSVVKDTLHNKFKKVWTSNNFEASWDFIANMLDVDIEPRLQSNIGGKEYNKSISVDKLDSKFINWHEKHNSFDYELYELFNID